MEMENYKMKIGKTPTVTTQENQTRVYNNVNELEEKTKRDLDLYNRRIYSTSRLESMMTIMNDFFNIMEWKDDPVMKKVLLKKCKEFEQTVNKDKNDAEKFIKFLVDLKKRIEDQSNRYNYSDSCSDTCSDSCKGEYKLLTKAPNYIGYVGQQKRYNFRNLPRVNYKE